MSSRITKKEFAEWCDRWKLVNAAEIEELRNTQLEVKLRQLAALMASVKELGWEVALVAEEEEVRASWLRIRKAYGL
jgi:hypothetical protein